MNDAQRISLQAIVPTTFHQLRLDQALAKLFPQYSRSLLQHWIKSGSVKVDHTICLKAKQKVFVQQLIQIETSIQPNTTWTAQNIPINITYEDESIIIINKPAGLVVHPGAGNPENTLVNALLHHAAELSLVPRAGIIHRLDKDTTGLLIIAKTRTAHHAFTQLLKSRGIKREYLAIAKGVILSGKTISAPIGRHATYRTKMTVTPTGRPATTHYHILEKLALCTFLRIELETGRTHQIRVHLNHVQHPLLGDPLYGKHLALAGKLTQSLQQALQQFNRQALHAFQLTFTHPITQQHLQFNAPLPADMEQLLQLLREDPHAID